jgi:ABC-type antimicrobial peptide transport system ATPase subunit
MMELIKGKLHGNILENPRLIAAGFPLEDIDKITLSTLLRIISRFEQGHKRKTVFNAHDGVPQELNALKIASDFLSKWPYGLYDYL